MAAATRPVRRCRPARTPPRSCLRAPRHARASTTGRHLRRGRRTHDRGPATSSRSSSLVVLIRSRAVRTPAWAATFASACCPIRYAATSTAAGRSRPAGAVMLQLDTEALGMPLQRSGKSVLVENRRPQVSGNPAQLAQCLARNLLQPPQLGLLDRTGRLSPTKGAELQADGGQRGTESVVQVATEQSPFLLPRLHQPLPTQPERLGQPDRVDRHSAVPADRGEKGAVFGGPPTGRITGHDDGSDLLGAREQGHRSARPLGPASARASPVRPASRPGRRARGETWPRRPPPRPAPRRP